MLWAGHITARLWMQFGNFGIKGLMLNPSIPSPPPSLSLKGLFPALLIHRQHWNSPAMNSISLGLLPGGFGVGAQRGSASCGSLSLGSPWTALQSPSVSPEHGEALVLCLQPAAFPPALEKFQAMANIYLREDFKMEKGGGKGAVP